jgi:hypothetical protein
MKLTHGFGMEAKRHVKRMMKQELKRSMKLTEAK